MVPDRGFTKQLKKLNEDYEVVWDWGSAKWEIWEFPSDGREAYHVLTVETQDKEYRQLGADILLKLQQIDPKKIGAKEILAYLEEMDAQERRKRRQAFKDRIESISRETFSYAMGILQVAVPREYSIARVVKV